MVLREPQTPGNMGVPVRSPDASSTILLSSYLGEAWLDLRTPQQYSPHKPNRSGLVMPQV